jgi:hypothetical protein
MNSMLSTIDFKNNSYQELALHFKRRQTGLEKEEIAARH